MPGQMTIEQQIAALDETAIAYALAIAEPERTNEWMAAYWWEVAQGWMMVLGLRKAQLRSLDHHGLVLIA